MIFLIGYPASGKTTLGRAMASRYGFGFIDLDAMVEEKAGCSVSEIFARSGEPGFRRLEAEALARVAATAGPRTLVACGGGTPCFGDNMELMLDAGTVVWLDSPVARLIERIRLAGDSRPLLAGMTDEELLRHVEANLAERSPFYSRAHLRFDSSRLDTADEIEESTSLFLSLISQPTV